VIAVQFAEEGKRIVSLDATDTIKVWDATQINQFTEPRAGGDTAKP
jgi:hypothetical protein